MARHIARLERVGTKAGYEAAEEYRRTYADACSGRDGPDSDVPPSWWDDEDEYGDTAAAIAESYQGGDR